MVGKVRSSVAALSSYTPGKSAAQAEAEHGVLDAIKLASNETPWSPPPKVAASIEAAIAGINRYGDNRAAPVREAIAAWRDLPVEMIATGCGSSGLLQQVMFTYVDPGDEVVFPWPSFEIYPVFCQLFGAVDVRIDLVDYAFDLEATKAAVTDRTKVVFLATPNNPTGTALRTADIATFLESIPDDVIVVVDEAYREFNDPSFGDPVLDLIPKFRNVIVTRTFSKAFGIAGARVGYAVADPEIVVQLDKVLLAFSVNNFAQAAAIAAIEHEADALERVSILVAERNRLSNAVCDAGWEIPDSHGNFVFIPTGEHTSAMATAMEQQGVVVRAFPDVGLRITISTAEENDRWFAAFLNATDG